MSRYLAIVAKEFRQISRDRLSLGLLIVFPAVLLVLYGYALSFDVKHLRVAVLDHDRTTESRRFLDRLFRNPYFDRIVDVSREGDLTGLLARGKVRLALVIPRGWAATLARGETGRVQALVDASDATTASTATGYLDALAEMATLDFRRAVAADAGREPVVPRVRIEPRIWYNPELVSAKFLVPGLISMLLMLSAVIVSSLSIVREKERQTIDQIRVSPARPLELIAGKITPYIAICGVTMGAILLAGRVLFGIEVQGSWAMLSLTTLCFLFAALGMGALVSSSTNSQQVAFMIAVIATMLPSIILSGMVFPIASMPKPIQVLTSIVPPRYFVSALRAIILKGAGFAAVWPQLAVLTGLGLVYNLLAARNTRRAL